MTNIVLHGIYTTIVRQRKAQVGVSEYCTAFSKEYFENGLTRIRNGNGYSNYKDNRVIVL